MTAVPAAALGALGELGHLAAEVHREAHVVVGLADRGLEGAGLVGGDDPLGEAGVRGARAGGVAEAEGRRERLGSRARSGGWRRRRDPSVSLSSTLRMKAFLSISPSSPKAPSAIFSSRRSATSSAAEVDRADVLLEIGDLALAAAGPSRRRPAARPGCARESASRRVRSAGSAAGSSCARVLPVSRRRTPSSRVSRGSRFRSARIAW